MTAAPYGAPQKAPRSGPSAGMWALIGCVALAVIAIILAAIAGIVLTVLARDDISPKATERIESSVASFDAPKNWVDAGSTDDDSYDYLYSRYEQSKGTFILVAEVKGGWSAQELCGSFSEGLEGDGALIGSADSRDFDGETSTAFTATESGSGGTFYSEYHCVEHGGATMLVVFQGGSRPARTSEGDGVIDSWTWS